MSEKQRIICIVGPTASGKTALSVELAKRYNGEIISADSMQLYRGIHIASAAPDAGEMCGVPHHMIEFLELSKAFTVADYVKAARGLISDIAIRGKMPFIVGGTGLYINALVDNIEFTEAKCDRELRRSLEKEFDDTGAEMMLEKLSGFDPEAAKRLHTSDRRRIIRAFEVYRSTGRTITEQNILSRQGGMPYEAVMIGLSCRDRERLYDRINRRVDIMLESGLIDEARTTLGLNRGDGAAQAIGHKELYGFLRGETTLETAAESLKRSTRRYAKRQLTWFGRDSRISWIYIDETSDIVGEAVRIIERQ